MQNKLTFSLTTLGTVALIVACSPNTKTQITQRGNAGGAGESKVMACSDSLHESEKLRVTNKTVVICENAESAKSTDKAVATEHAVSYSVEKEDSGKGSHGHVNLMIATGFSTTEDLTKDQQTDFIGKFDDVCGADAKTLIERTKVERTPLTLELKYLFAKGDGDVFNPNDQIDQTIRLVKFTDGEDSGFTLDQIPSRPKFYPKGKQADYRECVAQNPAGGKPQRDCIWTKRHDLNIPACAAFVKRLGNSLGIVDAEKEAETCNAAQPVKLEAATPTPTATASPSPEASYASSFEAKAVPQAKPTPTQPGNDGSSSFAKPRTTDSDFLKKAELNRKDVVSILTPVCPNELKDAK